jgi:hypothetical protein
MDPPQGHNTQPLDINDISVNDISHRKSYHKNSSVPTLPQQYAMMVTGTDDKPMPDIMSG